MLTCSASASWLTVCPGFRSSLRNNASRVVPVKVRQVRHKVGFNALLRSRFILIGVN